MILPSRFSKRSVSVASLSAIILSFVSCGGSGVGGDNDPWIPAFADGYTIKLDTTGGTQTGGNPGIVIIACETNNTGTVMAPKLSNTIYLVDNVINYIPINKDTASISFGHKLSPDAPTTETFNFTATFSITEKDPYNSSLSRGSVISWSRTSWSDHASVIGEGSDCPIGSATIIPTVEQNN